MNYVGFLFNILELLKKFVTFVFNLRHVLILVFDTLL